MFWLRHFMIHCRTLLGACIALAVSAATARAEYFVGSHAFFSTVPSLHRESGDTRFALSALALANQSGDDIGYFGTFSNVLDNSVPAAFVSGSDGYGRFFVQRVLPNSLISFSSRTVKLAGTLTPGALTFGVGQAAIGRRAVLSSSAGLATAEVPVPPTIVLLLTLLAPSILCSFGSQLGQAFSAGANLLQRVPGQLRLAAIRGEPRVTGPSRVLPGMGMALFTHRSTASGADDDRAGLGPQSEVRTTAATILARATIPSSAHEGDLLPAGLLARQQFSLPSYIAIARAGPAICACQGRVFRPPRCCAA